MVWLYSGLGACYKEQLNAFVPKALDHGIIVLCQLTGYNCFFGMRELRTMGSYPNQVLRRGRDEPAPVKGRNRD